MKVLRKKRKYIIISRIFGFFLAFLQLGFSVAAMIKIVRMQILPTWIEVTLGAILFALFLLVFLIQFTKKAHIFEKIIAVIICILLGITTFYVHKTEEAIEEVTVEKDVYVSSDTYVAVLADNTAENISDAADYMFGYFGSEEDMTNTLLNIENDTGASVHTTAYTDRSEMLSSFYDKTIDAMIFTGSEASLFTSIDEEFDTKIKVIAKYSEVELCSVEPLEVDVTSVPFIVYISGNDEWGEELSVTGRSDVNMLVAVNPNTGTVLLLNTPRDYFVPLPDVSDGECDKLTHAGNYGIDESIATLSELYGVGINYYARVNFSSVIKLIDAIGGITVNNDVDFYFTSEPDVTVEHGEITLDGEKALMYCRERYSLEDGDVERGYHQQLVLEALIDKLTSAQTLVAYSTLTDTLAQVCSTNMSKEAITSIIRNQLIKNTKWKVVKAHAEGECMFQPCFSTGTQPLSVMVPYVQSIENMREMLNNLINGEEVTALQMSDENSYELAAEIVDIDEEVIEDVIDKDMYEWQPPTTQEYASEETIAESTHIDELETNNTEPIAETNIAEENSSSEEYNIIENDVETQESS